MEGCRWGLWAGDGGEATGRTTRRSLKARLRSMVRFYARQKRISRKWQAIDNKTALAPLGGAFTGRNPANCGKRGAKFCFLVDERCALLALHVTGANQLDRWSGATKRLWLCIICSKNRDCRDSQTE